MAFTVTTAVLRQPVLSVYVIVDVPAVDPVTMPVEDPIKALLLLLFHVPPDGVEFNAVVKPAHTAAMPVIEEGFAFTVTTAVLRQPVLSVYVIVDVPAVEPVTIPVDEPIVALLLLLLQTPPDGVEFNVVVKPAHTLSVPVIEEGLGLTVTTAVLKQPVPTA